jgi:glycerol-3-phosphate dehydrogenase (NAD(P)+)
VAEGYYAASLIREVRKEREIKMPIADAVYKILYENKNPKKIMEKLTGKLN